MTTLKQVPLGLLQSLGLHKGDFLTVKEESPQGALVEITTTAKSAPELADHESVRRAAFTRFAAGADVPRQSTESELAEARFSDLRAKHLK